MRAEEAHEKVRLGIVEDARLPKFHEVFGFFSCEAHLFERFFKEAIDFLAFHHKALVRTHGIVVFGFPKEVRVGLSIGEVGEFSFGRGAYSPAVFAVIRHGLGEFIDIHLHVHLHFLRRIEIDDGLAALGGGGEVTVGHGAETAEGVFEVEEGVERQIILPAFELLFKFSTL